jgi:peptidoglycan/xylan/chitin deacetylase (PgdA/CDA1 family)
MNHANAWKYTMDQYKKDIQACDEIIVELKIDSVGFRPPYGRINSEIYRNLSSQYPIYMWSFLSGDYNHDLSTKSIIEAGKKHIKPGSILVFHDSIKAFPRLKVVLPALLDFCYQNHLTVKAL